MTVQVSQRRVIEIASPSTGEEEWLALREPLETGWLTQGPKVAEFQKAFALRHQVAHGLATTSCTTALHLAIAALGIGPDDEVIVPAFTWIATANAVLYCGAKPIFVDVLTDSYNIDPVAVARALTERTKAVIAVHLFGLCADIDALRSVLPDEVAIIEDAACAAGAAYRGTPAGGLGEVGCFSFHPRKSITTGEGGMLTTNSGALAARAEILRNHGADIPEEVRHSGPQPFLLPRFAELGFNYRMTDLQGAVGIVQLSKLDRFIEERDALTRQYVTMLGDVPWLRLPVVPDGYRHAWQAYVAVVDPASAPRPRNDLMAALADVGVSTRPGTHAVTETEYYRHRFNLDPAHFPIASRLAAETMAIPLHNRMTADDITYVSEALLKL